MVAAFSSPSGDAGARSENKTVNGAVNRGGLFQFSFSLAKCLKGLVVCAVICEPVSGKIP